MQISPPISPLLSPLTGAPAGPEARGKATQGAIHEPVAPRVETSEPVVPESDTADIVSVSPQAREQEASAMPAPVYAEIWKGGQKVAQVDIHGHVVSLNGMVASGGGSSLAGPLLAAQRAVQVAQQVGGEIRSAGQSLDGQTLLMRARLAKAYVN